MEPEHRFGVSAPLTIGVEEELLLVDEECRLIPDAERVIESLDPAAREAVSTEIFAAQIELKTGICGAAPRLDEVYHRQPCQSHALVAQTNRPGAGTPFPSLVT